MTVVDRAAPHRLRLLQAMAEAVAEKGYASVTIADIVAGAGVSKRTFYEHFDGKEDCLFACYAQASDALVDVVRVAARDVPPGVDQVITAVRAYYDALDAQGRLAAALLTEIQGSGAAGRTLRREKMHEFAGAILEMVSEGAAGAGEKTAFDAQQSIAMVGGLYELVLSHAESSPGVPFDSLAPAAERFVLAVLGLTPDSEAGCA